MSGHPYPQDYDGPSVLASLVPHVGQWRRDEIDRQIAEILRPRTARVYGAKGMETPEARSEWAELIQAVDEHWDEL